MPNRFARSLCGILAFVAGHAALHAEVPDPSLASKALPGADKAAAPDVIKPGTRLTYLGSNAMHPVIRERLVLNERNEWVGEKTRSNVLQGIAQGSGGVGYTVSRVGHVDREVAVVTSSTYLLDTFRKTVTPTGSAGFVGNAGSAGDMWVNPAVLKKVEEKNENGNLIQRGPYTIGNRKHNVIRFQSDTKSGHNVMVYDTDSGLLLFRASSVLDFTARNRGPEGQELQPGQTHTSTSVLVEVKDIDVPWKGQPVPQWVGQFRELKYEGAVTTAAQGVTPNVMPMAITIVPKARENGWLRYGSTTVTQPYRLPPQTSTQEGAAGAASVGGLWIAPQALAALKAGQVIETNEVIGTKTVVSDVSRGVVTFSEVGAVHRIDIAYDMASGIMSGVSHKTQDQLSTRTAQMRLTGQR
jgi:hypothetical protein